MLADGASQGAQGTFEIRCGADAGDGLRVSCLEVAEGDLAGRVQGSGKCRQSCGRRIVDFPGHRWRFEGTASRVLAESCRRSLTKPICAAGSSSNSRSAAE
jgi:hypothetical protein